MASAVRQVASFAKSFGGREVGEVIGREWCGWGEIRKHGGDVASRMPHHDNISHLVLAGNDPQQTEQLVQQSRERGPKRTVLAIYFYLHLRGVVSCTVASTRETHISPGRPVSVALAGGGGGVVVVVVVVVVPVRTTRSAKCLPLDS
jgi:hypothetical protein